MSSFIYQHSIGRFQNDEKAIKKALNGYLYAEFGFDLEDETRVSDNWPFELHPLGTLQMPYGDVHVFEFYDEDEAYFAISGFSLTYYRAEGMTFDELRIQEIGSAWVSLHEPIGLDTIRLGDETVPSIKQRRAIIEALAAKAFPGDASPRILEGLFLRSTGEYLALVQHSMSEDIVIVGNTIEPWPIILPLQSAWRKLAYGVGQMIESGRLQKVQVP